jgi:hypothetical protein
MGVLSRTFSLKLVKITAASGKEHKQVLHARLYAMEATG